MLEIYEQAASMSAAVKRDTDRTNVATKYLDEIVPQNFQTLGREARCVCGNKLSLILKPHRLMTTFIRHLILEQADFGVLPPKNETFGSFLGFIFESCSFWTNLRVKTKKMGA